MKLEVFLDTTYLMPFFGLETSIENLNNQFIEILKQEKYKFLFSPIAIIEIKWQLFKLVKSGYDEELLETSFSQALSSLEIDKRFSVVNFIDSKINDIAYELRKIGHNDYFDTIIASSAIWNASIFVTEDKQLKGRIQALFKNKQ